LLATTQSTGPLALFHAQSNTGWPANSGVRLPRLRLIWLKDADATVMPGSPALFHRDGVG